MAEEREGPSRGQRSEGVETGGARRRGTEPRRNEMDGRVGGARPDGRAARERGAHR